MVHYTLKMIGILAILVLIQSEEATNHACSKKKYHLKSLFNLEETASSYFVNVILDNLPSFWLVLSLYYFTFAFAFFAFPFSLNVYPGTQSKNMLVKAFKIHLGFHFGRSKKNKFVLSGRIGGGGIFILFFVI